MQPCIILDSNIWISNLLLRTPISSALIYGIVQKGARIGLPYVVMREIMFHTERMGLEILDAALEGIRMLNYFDDGANLAKFCLPNKDKISKALPIRLTELSDIILQHKHTPEEMEQALEMVLRKLPPNSDKNQQYKDSLLWQAVLNLADEFEVHFVTRDKGFFKNKKYKEGPADNICKDIESKGNDIFIYSEIEECAKILHTFEESIDVETIINNIFIAVKDELKKEVKEEGYILKDLESGQLEPFITSDPSKIAVKFSIDCNIIEREDYEPYLPLFSFSLSKGVYEPEDSEKPEPGDSKRSYAIFGGYCFISIENYEISGLYVRTKTWAGKWGYHSDGYLGKSIWSKNGPQIYGKIDPS